ncbi:hypothetical protein M405DRAFT_88707 [Rhizopogon salebrosus TDB-379]|nr:hypothetical protein M405DRAFT_88707 [Rhizopogon salebrosus TDB-379]
MTTLFIFSILLPDSRLSGISSPCPTTINSRFITGTFEGLGVARSTATLPSIFNIYSRLNLSIHRRSCVLYQCWWPSCDHFIL